MPDTCHLLSASAPALATWESCDDKEPDTPMAPMILPSTMTGKPPSIGVMAFSANSRMPAPPAAMASSSALLGRLNSSAVRALPSVTVVADSWALSALWNMIMLPPLSRMVMATCQEFLAASSSAAAMARLAWSRVIGGPYGNVAADGAETAGVWAKAGPAVSANAQASANNRNIW